MIRWGLFDAPQGMYPMMHKLDRFFGKAGESLEQLSWTVLRMLASAMFMTHGYAKLFGENPQVFRGGGMTTVNIANTIVFAMPLNINALFVAGVIELFGGLLILIGLWTHMISFIAMLLMAMAYLTAHFAWFPTLNNGELAAMYFLVYLALFSTGPGQFSLDWLFEQRRQKKQKNKREAHGIP